MLIVLRHLPFVDTYMYQVFPPAIGTYPNVSSSWINARSLVDDPRFSAHPKCVRVLAVELKELNAFRI